MLILFALATPWAANSLTLSLEQKRTNPLSCSDHSFMRPIVVLGGGTNGFSESSSPYDILKAASLKRALEAADLYRPGQHFFLLGGGLQQYKEADLMAEILLARGVPAKQLTLENSSLSTKENARELKHIFNANKLDPRITLLSSATHIPRASKTFEKHGFQVCHHAVDFKYSESTMPHNMLPYVDALEKSSIALHEYIGLAYYWLTDDV